MKYEKILHITTLTLAYLPTLIFQGQETITVNRVNAGLSQGGSIIYLEGEQKFSHVNKNSCEYEKILSSLNKNFHESEKNSRPYETISCKSEKLSHLNKNS